MKTMAIVLAAGRGSRMKSQVKKQYMAISGRPVLCYCLEVFQKCGRIDGIILVCGSGEQAYCRSEIVSRYGFSKVEKIIEGGKERYHSVHEGLKAIEDCDYVLIHDGARPFVDEAMLDRILAELPSCHACVVGMPVKDTIKLSNDEGYVAQTLPRERLWSIQTPQSFAYPLIREAYDRLAGLQTLDVQITDDAMVAEYMMKQPVKLIEGSYENIKITTPEDIPAAEAIVRARLTRF